METDSSNTPPQSKLLLYITIFYLMHAFSFQKGLKKCDLVKMGQLFESMGSQQFFHSNRKQNNL
jgi:hypothetical protein